MKTPKTTPIQTPIAVAAGATSTAVECLTPARQSLIAHMPIRLRADILIDQGEIPAHIQLTDSELAYLLMGGYVSKSNQANLNLTNPTEESL